MTRTSRLWIGILTLSLAPYFSHATEGPADQALSTVAAAFAAELKTRNIRLSLQAVPEKEVGLAAVRASSGAVPIQVARSQLFALSLAEWQMVLCHEVGHLLGGAPYTWVNQDEGGEFSAEGQADYFAATKCLRRVWISAAENARVVQSFSADEIAAARARGCVSDTCLRIAVTALHLLARLDPEETISLSESSPEVARETKTQPTALDSQCRLDTMMAGAICPVSPYMPFGAQNERDGACQTDGVTKAERVGARPPCWYRP